MLLPRFLVASLTEESSRYALYSSSTTVFFSPDVMSRKRLVMMTEVPNLVSFGSGRPLVGLFFLTIASSFWWRFRNMTASLTDFTNSAAQSCLQMSLMARSIECAAHLTPVIL